VKILLNMLGIQNVQKDNKLPLFVMDFDDDNRIGFKTTLWFLDNRLCISPSTYFVALQEACEYV
jgi:hypothetical protein